MIDKASVLAENQRRLSEMYSPYDPLLGIGSPIERKSLAFTCAGRDVSFNVPLSMYDEFRELFVVLNSAGSMEASMSILGIKGSANVLLSELLTARLYHDFEYWAFQCGKIQDKRSKKPISFRLNRPQRRTLASLEKDRMAGVPIRTIIVKARQWGGSTLVQIYMAWLQLLHYENWHSLIVTDVENQARTIRGMYSRLMTHYPAYLGKFKLTPFEGSSKNKIIKEKGCVISIGSVQKPESLRSNDISMCHLSEVAFWKTTQQKSAEDLVQTIRPSIPSEPGTLIVLESTAKGVGSMFHHEWTSAVEGESGYTPVFVPWFEIEMYQEAIGSENVSAFIDKVFSDAYYQFLWDEGASLEGINWYINYKSSENWSDWRMQSEFPTTSQEAFQSTNQRVFAPDYVRNARRACIDPVFIGDVTGASMKGREALQKIEFVRSAKGQLLVWSLPEHEERHNDRYVVSVDIGGRTDKADWSIIRVFDRYWMAEGGYPEAVATWRGHLDQDLVAWKAAQIAKFYNSALLLVESNSLDKDSTDGSHFLTVLDEIAPYYDNLFARNDPEKIRQGLPLKYGFMTSHSTKGMIIDTLNALLRDEAYVERDVRVCDEMDTYEIKPDGTLGAVNGCHDDMVMATAIGVWACVSYLPPFSTKQVAQAQRRVIVSEATI